MPPAYAHAKREFAALKGRLGSRGTFEKVTKEALWECFSFPRKPGKSAFRFTKSIKGRFSAIFRMKTLVNSKYI